MKILISSKDSTYTKGSVGGAETSMRLLAEKLAENGHTVYYVARKRGEGFTITLKKIAGVHVILYPNFTPGGPVKTDAEQPEGVKVIFSFLKWAKISLIKRLNKFLFDRAIEKANVADVDIVYLYDQMSLLRYFVEKRRSGARYKIVMRMAGLLWYKKILQGPKKRRIFREIFDELDAVNYISAGLKLLAGKKASEIGFKLDFRHSFVGDIGVDPDALPELRKEERNDKTRNEPLWIMVATRFSLTQKRHDLLVEAVRLIDSNVAFEVVMIGDGPRKASIRKMIRDYELEGIIRVEPFRNQEDLWKEMQRADLLCHPTDYEGLGKIVVESMALGLPVLASDVLPLNNYIEDDVTGFLVKNDPEAWATRLTGILEEREKLQTVSDASKEWVHHHLSADRCVKIFENEFRQLLQEHRKSGK